MIEYKFFVNDEPPLNIELVVRSNDTTFKSAKVVTFESKYSDDVVWHFQNLPKSINQWGFVHGIDEKAWNKKQAKSFLTNDRVEGKQFAETSFDVAMDNEIDIKVLEGKIEQLNNLLESIKTYGYTTIEQIRGDTSISLDILHTMKIEKEIANG